MWGLVNLYKFFPARFFLPVGDLLFSPCRGPTFKETGEGQDLPINGVNCP